MRVSDSVENSTMCNPAVQLSIVQLSRLSDALGFESVVIPHERVWRVIWRRMGPRSFELLIALFM